MRKHRVSADATRRLMASQPDHEAVAGVLLDAADILEVDGHCGGKWTNAQGAHCVTGAIAVATGLAERGVPSIGCSIYPDQGALPPAAYESLADFLGQSPWGWNDGYFMDRRPTKQEAVDALQSAAKAELRLADGADR